MAAILDESGIGLLDESGVGIYDESGVPIAASAGISVTIECNVYEGMDVQARIETNVGAPYQGNIRNLATDRWYSMYPS